MDLSQYTQQVREALQGAQAQALSRGHQHLLPEHMLIHCLGDPANQATLLVQRMGVNPAMLQQDLQASLDKQPRVEGGGAGRLYLSPDLERVVDKAHQLARGQGDTFVGMDQWLHAMVSLSGIGLHPILQKHDINDKRLGEEIRKMRQGKKIDSENAESQFESLKKFTIDLTQRAREGKIDPVIGREGEIRRTIQVLSRRTKNNPVLIGEPGVGKTAIVEGLALRIINGDVPDSLKNTQLLALDLAGLVAGAKFRGEFEERLKSVLKEIDQQPGEIILFIDELHTLVGAGRADGAMDAANMLKPALARGELHCVGATTLDEYRQYIEKDAALARRFQSVFVDQPSVEETISILRGLREKYELHHGIRITDDALISAARLSDRYITDRFLPDKAIDLVDEAASGLRMEAESKPQALDLLDRKIIQLKIEREALKREPAEKSKERLDFLEESLHQLEAESNSLTQEWQREKERLGAVHKDKEELDRARAELETAQRRGNLTRAGELMYGMIPNLEKKIQEAAVASHTSALVREEVTDQDIAQVVSRWTGIPVDKMMRGAQERLIDMESALQQRVVGQPVAVEAISQAVRRAYAGLQDPSRPMGAFLMVGPTGVGKTELAKALAAFLFDNETAMTRIDMSEYMEKHAVARLIGAPPGYVGYEEGGTLTESVRRRPYQVILLDEVEKAHRDVFNLFLQVFDDGRLTDSQGRTIDFRQTLILMTSNLGSEAFADLRPDQTAQDAAPAVMAVVRQAFRPEFLNRLDDIILFNRLAREDMTHIVGIQIRHLEKLLAARHVTLEVSQAAQDLLAQQGYDPAYGARPLKRVIQRTLQNPLAEAIIAGKLQDHITVDAQGEDLVIS